MKNLIQFKPEETNRPAFEVARKLLLVNCIGIHATVRELVRSLHTSELYAKSVVVHVMTKAYLP